MAFEKYEKNSRVGSGNVDPMISIRASNTIGINKPAMEEFFEDATHIVTHYDPDTDRVALEPDAGETEGAYKISRSNDSGALGCNGFLRDNGIDDEEKSRQYTPYIDEMEDGTEAVMLDVGDPDSTVVTSSSDNEDSDE